MKTILVLMAVAGTIMGAATAQAAGISKMLIQRHHTYGGAPVETYLVMGAGAIQGKAKQFCADQGSSVKELSQFQVGVDSGFLIESDGRTSSIANPIITVSAYVICERS